MSPEFRTSIPDLRSCHPLQVLLPTQIAIHDLLYPTYESCVAINTTSPIIITTNDNKQYLYMCDFAYMICVQSNSCLCINAITYAITMLVSSYMMGFFIDS